MKSVRLRLGWPTDDVLFSEGEGEAADVSTVTLHVALHSPQTAVTVVFPAFTAFTKPFSSTVTTAGFWLLQLTVVSICAVSGSGIAESCTVSWEDVNWTSAGEMEMPVSVLE